MNGGPMYMTPADALKAMVYPTMGRTTRSVEAWAAAADMTPSSLYAKCAGERPITTKDVVLLTNLTRDSFLMEALCAATGHMALSVRQLELSTAAPLYEQVADAVRQQAEAIAAICESVKDGVVTDDERATIDREIVEMMSSMNALRAKVEAMPRRVASPDNVKQLRATM